jgi:hypothetical protein
MSVLVKATLFLLMGKVSGGCLGLKNQRKCLGLKNQRKCLGLKI